MRMIVREESFSRHTCVSRTVPPRSLLLLEDIDSAIRRSESQSDSLSEESASSFRSRASQGDSPTLTQLSLNPYGSRSVTYSGLLNALDGVRRIIQSSTHFTLKEFLTS